MNQNKVSKTERLLNLISFMLRSRRPVPFAKIAGHVVGYDDEARLDSIEKRFDRDKAELRNMGIPVEYVDGGSPEASGYIIPRDRFFLREINLDRLDTLILSLAGRSGPVTVGSPLIKEAFASALRKLAVDAPLTEADDLPAVRASLLQVSSGHGKVTEILQTICSAVYARRTIAFAYQGRRDADPTKRRVDPYGLGLDRGEWYLAGRCHERDDVRLFRLSRVQGNVNLTGASDAANEFEIPQGFSIEQHLFREDWDYGSAEPTRVELELPRPLALQIRHQSRLRFSFLAGGPDEAETATSRIEVRAASPERMADWILSLGPAVKVLEPETLARVVDERLEAHAALYAEEGPKS
jgi:proteasome accessory factor B